MKQDNTTPSMQLKDGDIVYHKLIKQDLIVRADEKGPAFTGKEYAENEISLSYALIELSNGYLSLNKPTPSMQSKEEQNNTPGKWEVWEEINVRSNTGRAICSCGVTQGTQQSRRENIANAKLIAAAPELKAEVTRLSELNEELMDALIAIDARLNGDFDNPRLMLYGELSESETDDVQGFAKEAIEKYNNSKSKRRI